MTVELVANVVSALLGLAGMFAAAFMWIGSQKARLNSQEARIAALETQLKGHTDTALLVHRLEERMENLKTAVDRQPALIATVVAAAIKEVVSAMRVRPAAV